MFGTLVKKYKVAEVGMPIKAKWKTLSMSQLKKSLGIKPLTMADKVHLVSSLLRIRLQIDGKYRRLITKGDAIKILNWDGQIKT